MTLNGRWSTYLSSSTLHKIFLAFSSSFSRPVVDYRSPLYTDLIDDCPVAEKKACKTWILNLVVQSDRRTGQVASDWSLRQEEEEIGIRVSELSRLWGSPSLRVVLFHLIHFSWLCVTIIESGFILVQIFICYWIERDCVHCKRGRLRLVKSLTVPVTDTRSWEMEEKK